MQHEMAEFRALLRAVLPMVVDGGKILLFHVQRRGPIAIDGPTIVNIFAPSDRLEVGFSGSRWSDLALRLHDRARRMFPSAIVAGVNLAPLAALTVASPFSLLGNLRSRPPSVDDGKRVPSHSASMVLSLPVDDEVRAELEGW
jgi:hypothetical protein